MLFQDDTFDRLTVPQSAHSIEDTPDGHSAKDLKGNSYSKTKGAGAVKNSDGVNFKNIKDQLQDIQNVAKNAEKSLAQLSVKNSISIGSNKGTISTKTFKNSGDESVKSGSKMTLFKHNNNVSGSAKKIQEDSDMMEQT